MGGKLQSAKKPSFPWCFENCKRGKIPCWDMECVIAKSKSKTKTKNGNVQSECSELKGPNCISIHQRERSAHVLDTVLKTLNTPLGQTYRYRIRKECTGTNTRSKRATANGTKPSEKPNDKIVTEQISSDKLHRSKYGKNQSCKRNVASEQKQTT